MELSLQVAGCDPIRSSALRYQATGIELEGDMHSAHPPSISSGCTYMPRASMYHEQGRVQCPYPKCLSCRIVVSSALTGEASV